MRILIAEDEWLAAERLRHLIKEVCPEAEVIAVCESIEETVAYLQQYPHPDLLIFDIHLSDGHSFRIFESLTIQIPVIFATAFDRYAIEAFRHFSIDYILKPVTAEALQRAIGKFRSLRPATPMPDYSGLLKQLSEWKENRYKARFLAKVGQKLFFVETEDIAYFQAENKLVYLVDREANRYVIDYTLEKLEALLDPAQFFRLNRKFLIRYTAIQQIRPYSNSRLRLMVKGAPSSEEIVISRERVADFKQWAEA